MSTTMILNLPYFFQLTRSNMFMMKSGFLPQKRIEYVSSFYGSIFFRSQHLEGKSVPKHNQDKV